MKKVAQCSFQNWLKLTWSFKKENLLEVTKSLGISLTLYNTDDTFITAKGSGQMTFGS